MKKQTECCLVSVEPKTNELELAPAETKEFCEKCENGGIEI